MSTDVFQSRQVGVSTEPERILVGYITQGNPAMATANGHTFQQNEKVQLTGMASLMPQVNGLFFTVSNPQRKTVIITGITQANPAVVTAPGTYLNGAVFVLRACIILTTAFAFFLCFVLLKVTVCL
jgi:hypothetical protein